MGRSSCGRRRQSSTLILRRATLIPRPKRFHPLHVSGASGLLLRSYGAKSRDQCRCNKEGPNQYPGINLACLLMHPPLYPNPQNPGPVPCTLTSQIKPCRCPLSMPLRAAEELLLCRRKEGYLHHLGEPGPENSGLVQRRGVRASPGDAQADKPPIPPPLGGMQKLHAAGSKVAGMRSAAGPQDLRLHPPLLLPRVL